MPKYKYPIEGGKFLTLEGDEEPSDAEIEHYAQLQGVKLVDPSAPTKPTGPVKPIPGADTYKGPDTFMGGVMDSINPFGSGDAIGAGLRGGLGWLKGATIDLPGSMLGGLETIGNAITDPIGTVKSIPQGLSNMWDTATQAGSDPDAFGRMVGQLTGQPLVTAGLAKGIPEGTFGSTRAIPSAKPLVGRAMEGTGSIMRRYQPITGFLPKLAEGRTMRNIERGIGGKVEKMGQRLQRPSIPKVSGTVVDTPPVVDAQFSEVPPQAPPGPRQLGPSTTDFYHPESFESAMPEVPPNFMDEVIPQQQSQMPLGLPPSEVGYYMDAPFDLGPQSPTAASHMNSPATPHSIPEAPVIPETPAAPAPVDIKIVPKKTLNNNVLAHMKSQGYQIIGIDEKGNFTFSK